MIILKLFRKNKVSIFKKIVFNIYFLAALVFVVVPRLPLLWGVGATLQLQCTGL